MLLNNDINEAYDRICREMAVNEDDIIVSKPIENPFSFRLYERIVEDLEELESPNGEFTVTNVSLGPNGGVLVELSLDSDKDTEYTLEYIENECIYWQIIKDDDYKDGCSQEIPF